MDIVEQLKSAHTDLLGQAYDRSIFLEAATEIENLRAEVEHWQVRYGRVVMRSLPRHPMTPGDPAR